MDEVTLREFVYSDYPAVVAAVALISQSRAAAEDALQEALARAWERPFSLRSDLAAFVRSWSPSERSETAGSCATSV